MSRVRSISRVGVRLLAKGLPLCVAVALLLSLIPANRASAASENVLFNPGFEGGWHTTSMSSRVADGWNPWFAIDPNNPASREPEYGVVVGREGQAHSGNQSQRWFNSYGVHDAGVWAPAKVPVGSYVRFSIWVWTNSSQDDAWGASSAYYKKWVGIDPTGGNYVASPEVVWSPMNVEMDKWVLMTVSAQAKSETVTVFVRGIPYFPVKHNDVLVDDASVVYDLSETPAAPEGAAVGAEATATPTPEPAPQATLQPAPAEPAPGVEGASATFEGTNHAVKGEWLKWFNRNGGVDNNGLPRSEVIVDPITGQWVQYFQRVVLEWHPENPGEHRIQRRLLGDILYPGADDPVTPTPASSNSYVFYDTSGNQQVGLGHGVSDFAPDGTRIGFMAYFTSHGGLTAFGYPKEEPKLRDGRWTQRFQAALFEYHPENASPYTVQLELLGDEYIAQNHLVFQ
jgi:hypothetical protein